MCVSVGAAACDNRLHFFRPYTYWECPVIVSGGSGPPSAETLRSLEAFGPECVLYRPMAQ